MFIRSCCTRCQRPLRVLASYEGKTLRCPGCAAAVVVSAAVAAVGEAPSPPAQEEPAQAAKALPATGRLLPWILLMPAALALVPWVWVGQGILWAVLGVVLGGLCLLLGQHGRWPVSVRVAVSLSLAFLGHGLTLAAPLRSAQGMATPGNAPALASLSPLAAMSTRSSAANASAPRSERTAPASMSPPRQATSLRLTRSDLRPVTLLGDLLTVSVYLRPGGKSTALVTTVDGCLKDFTYPYFRLRATYRLEQTAYRTIVDARRGVLWAAACLPVDLRANRHGDQPLGHADLHVYDIPPVAAKQSAETPQLHPRRVLPLGSDILELLISPDHETLFYLAQGQDGVRLGRIDAERQTVECQVSLPKAMRTVCLTPDGKTLYAAGSGSILAIDPDTLNTRRQVEVQVDIRAIAADNEECLYLAERGQWTQLTRLMLRGEQPEFLRWTARMHGRIYLKMAPDQYRLYVGTSSLVSDHLDSLLLRGHPWQTPPVAGLAVSRDQMPVQGEFFLTPDGRFLINRWGAVFRLTQGKPFLESVQD